METLFFIILASIAMSLIAWIGLITLSIKEELLKDILIFLVAFSAGALLGGAFLHLIPESILKGENTIIIFIWLLIGFAIFFLMEQFLQWQHTHKVASEYKEPVGYLILVADAIHNFIGGLAIASSFMVNLEVGIITWIACAAHEIPQELGDFGILLNSGWKKYNALIFNFISALTIIPGGILTFFLSTKIDTTFLLAFAAGNFIYIACSDLIPEIKHRKFDFLHGLGHFLTFILGIVFLLWVRIVFG